ncbi:MAG: acyl-CoA synthetase [Desulfobacteraceae bacterium]|nr:acyl-CoA synthetase [Desulfobacteraceae bacterium]MBL7171707.1 acyl-CoA synthetase [Desulfobacteraceae bacterium]
MVERPRIATLADILEVEKIPIEQRLNFFNTYDMLRHGAAIDPEAPAISFFLSGADYTRPMRLTYREFLANVTRTANLFHDLGVGPGDVVSYLLPNLPQTHYILWGGEAAGIVNPINPMLEPSTIREICQAAGTKVLVALGEFEGSDIWEKVSIVRKDLPKLKAIIRVMGPGDEKEGIYGYDEAITGYKGDKLDSGRVIDPDDIASMYHTGGTTGTPKLAPHTHFNEAVMAFMVALATELKTEETTLCGLPLFHVNGTTVTGSMPFSIGAHVVLLGVMGYRDPTVIRNFYKIVEHYRAVTFSSVPTVLSVLLDIPKGDADISSLRFAVCGAAPLSVELFKRFEAHSGMKIIEGYGLTEGTCVSSVNPYYGEQKVGSIGMRIPYHEMKVFISDDENRFVREAETDEIGSVCIKGPNVFKGYLDETHNRGIWPKEEWFNTGDLGRQDKDGYFWLTGRKKELIIRGGHNIDPAAIEEPLYRFDGVQLAAAVGRPDPHAGEVPVAYVQLQEGADLTPEQILDYLKREVGERAAVPKEVLILDRIPLTPVGKIFKPALRWEAIKQVYRKELQALGEMVDSVEVTVREDKVHGSLAIITVRPASGVSAGEIENKVDEILARYTVRFHLEIV